MLIIFPADMTTPGQVDSAYEDERAMARSTGHETGLVDDDMNIILKKPKLGYGPTMGVALYRGWMLTPTQYSELYRRVWARGYSLINTPAEYTYAHELPGWYEDFMGKTPDTVWFPLGGRNDDDYMIAEVRSELGDGPYILKDYVKSKKHEWATKCFIESHEDIPRVMAAFCEDGDIHGGLVFRKFVPFDVVGKHVKSGMPLHHEMRFFVLNGGVLSAFAYWGKDEGAEDVSPPSHDVIQGFLHDTHQQTRARSNFFTMDLARAGDTWMLVELGDGQVAGLPPHSNAREFYSFLYWRYP